MPKLNYLLARYARPFYRRLALCALAVAVAAGIAAAFGYPEAAAIAVVVVVAAVAAVTGTVAISVGNVLAAAWLHRGIYRFEDAYNSDRKANRIADIFYEAMDLEEAALQPSRET